MAYMSALSACVACRGIFSYNPERVPSVRVHGIREPICRACMEAANAVRRTRRLAPITALPGAYDAEEVA